MKATHIIEVFEELWMLVCNVLFNEGGSDEQLLAVLAPVFSFALLSDVWFCTNHEFPVIGMLPFIIEP